MFGALAQSLASLGTGLVCTGGVQCVAAWHAAGAGHPDTGMGGGNIVLIGSCWVQHYGAVWCPTACVVQVIG